MKIGIWHEKIQGNAGKHEKTFQDYATKYIKFIKDNNIQRAFFLLMDPNNTSKSGTYAKNGWIEKYWLNKLPANCEAGLVMDTEPSSPWVGANKKPFKSGDTMELAFQYVANLNKTASKKITCLGFDYESVKAYYGKTGENWIETLWKKYNINKVIDYGYNPSGPPPKPQGTHSYPEIYWVGELAPVGCKGKKGPKCKCPYTPYCSNTNTLLNGKLGSYIENHKVWLSNPNVWPMFSVECLSQTNCVGSPYTKTNPCGVVDAFGTWSKADFMKFLNTVESKYGIKQAMIYEWNYIPTDWLTTPPPLTLFKKILKSCKILIKKYLSI